MGEMWPENLRRAVVDELEKGREFTAQVLRVLQGQEPVGDHREAVLGELVGKIAGTFDVGVSMLSSGDVFRAPVGSTQVGSGDRGRSVDSGESGKWPVEKNRRGSYKRRRTSDSCIKFSHTFQDVYAWRKYGQKQILNAKYPRCYFRCTHKPDQGCKATKQVQRIKEEPIMYQITYFGDHTCKDSLVNLSDNNYLDNSDHLDSNLMSFYQSDTTFTDQTHQLIYPFASPMKRELKEETQSNISSNTQTLRLESDSSAGPATTLATERGEDVVSGVNYSSASTEGLEFLIDQPVDFESNFHLDEIGVSL